MARRGWGEGSIFFDRRRKRWAASARTPEGRRTVYAPTREAAKARLAELRHPVPRRGRVMVGEYALSWLAAIRPTVKPASYVMYEGHAVAQLEELHALPVDAVEPQHIRAVQARMVDEGYAPSTIAKTLLTARRIFDMAVSDGLRETNPASAVRPPRVERAIPPRIGFPEARRILDAFAGHRLGSLVTLALTTGLRRGELLALTWADVDLEARELRVERSKTAAGVRTVPLPDLAVEVLTALPRDAVRLFPFDGSTVTHAFQRRLVEAGLPRLRFHDLRHAHATMLLAAGIRESVIRDQLGHRSIRMTERYAQVVPEAQREAARAIGERLR